MPTQKLPKPTCEKISSQVRQARISSLKEDIANIEQQLLFKDKRHQQAESVQNYKLHVCDEITKEIHFVTKKKREVNAELQKLQGKERKAKWYRRRKASKSSASNITSDESDFPLSSSPGPYLYMSLGVMQVSQIQMVPDRKSKCGLNIANYKG